MTVKRLISGRLNTGYYDYTASNLTTMIAGQTHSVFFTVKTQYNLKNMRKLYAALLLFLIGLMSPNFVVASNYDTDHLVFIDKSLHDYKILESSINLQASAIILINPENYEGILKMTEEIQKYDGLKSIHIVGHAKPAELILGADSFWMDDLNMIQKELNSWKRHLSAGADLFLYGCSLAETDKGKETVNLMASLTGMDVTASTNLTGNSSFNGDWELEYKTGTIESPIAFSTEIKNYKHSLQSLNYSDLRTFDKVNEGSGVGNWTFPDGTGRTAYQSTNTSDPVYLLSKESGYLNQVYKGTISVASSAGDDDDIGFAFGFNGVNDTYIWSWDMKGMPMGVRTGGAHLLYHKTGTSRYGATFPAVGTIIDQGSDNDPWVHDVTYQVEILYTADRIRIKVDGVEKFDVTAAQAGVAQFPPGKFGFYNLSQAGVTFGNMQNAPASDDPVPPTAQDDSYGMTPNTNLIVDNLDGILKNDYDANLDEFTIVKTSDVSHGTLSLDTDDGSFTYTPTTNYQGVDEFTYKLVQNDNNTESAIRTVTFGIITSNQAPTDIQLSNISISEGAANNTSIGILSTTDANNPDDEHDYSLTDNGGGRFTVYGNSLIVLNSSLLTSGDYSITVRSTDLMEESYTESFTISVIANEKPTSSNTQISMDSGSSFSFQSSDFPFNDTDGDTFGGIRIETAETAGDLEYNDSDVFNEFVINDISLLKFKAPEDASGNPYSTFTFKVVDSRGGISTSSYTMSIEVKSVPTITTTAISLITTTTATGNGNITATGGANITERGIYWSTSAGFADGEGTKVSTTGDWSTTSTFTQSITGLTGNTTYYVRAYATNTAGTAYGEEVSFTTLTPMTLEFDTNLSDGTTITLPLDGTVNVIVDWGDDSSETFTSSGTQDHTYSAEGTYTVSISGTVTHFGVSGYSTYTNADKLVRVSSFGDIGLTSLYKAFFNALNLEEVPVNLPVAVTDLGYTFYNIGKESIIGLDSWNVSHVTNMFGLFCNAKLFNQDISSWDVSAVIDMSRLFYSAEVFNQNLDSWNVGSVTNMSSMFYSAKVFNQPLNSWDVSKVTNMSTMFQSASEFNQDLNGWDVSHVTTMHGMFNMSSVFNQDIGDWNVSNVTDMKYMFHYAFAFNQDIGDWNVSNVTNMFRMFMASKFNQPLNNWNVGKVTNMSHMFCSAPFDQDISAWNVSNVTDMTNMFCGKLSTTNYDNLLKAWAQLDLVNGVNFKAGFSRYTFGEAATARQSIIDIHNWTITDWGMEPYLAEVSTSAVSEIGTTTATGNGDITSLGYPTPSQYGVCWGTAAEPTVDLSTKTEEGAASATDAFTSNIIGLTPGETYYARAYATNSAGTSYGGQVSFTTLKQSQAITFGALASKTYGDFSFNLLGSASSDLTVSYTSSNPAVATVSGNTVTVVGVGSTSITASQSGDASYNAATNVVQTLTIGAKEITITADAKTKIHGQTDPALTYQITVGTLVGDDALTGSLSRATGENIGDYAISSSLANANYTITYVPANLSITEKAVTISNFSDMTKMYYDGSFNLVAPTSNSAGAFTYTSSNTAVATVSGTTVAILSAGTTVIRANQAQDAPYAGGSITATLTVSSVSVVTKHGENTSTNPNYVDSNGAVGGGLSVTKNGKLESTKTK